MTCPLVDKIRRGKKEDIAKETKPAYRACTNSEVVLGYTSFIGDECTHCLCQSNLLQASLSESCFKLGGLIFDKARCEVNTLSKFKSDGK